MLGEAIPRMDGDAGSSQESILEAHPGRAPDLTASEAGGFQPATPVHTSQNTASLPVGVLIPTRNSMALLPRHMEAMKHWLDLVPEVVVVDSESRDGTVEYLRDQLAGRNARFFHHPPGLFGSWNFGIRQLTAPYTYISTVGDAMTRDGLLHLAEVAQQFNCDVVISPPDIVDESGRPQVDEDGPIYRLISRLRLQAPTCLDGLLPFMVAMHYFPGAILGSCASNLFRTAVLQERPFPVEFGANGDGVWGVLNAPRLRLGVTPTRLSVFRHHRKANPPAEFAPTDADQLGLEAGIRALELALAEQPQRRAEVERLGLGQYLQNKRSALRWRTELNRHREHPWPWLLYPPAWRARFWREIARLRIALSLRAALAPLVADN